MSSVNVPWHYWRGVGGVGVDGIVPVLSEATEPMNVGLNPHRLISRSGSVGGTPILADNTPEVPPEGWQRDSKINLPFNIGGVFRHPDAACIGLAPEMANDIFFGSSSTEAEKFCAECPANAQCLDFAINARDHLGHPLPGIWAGTTATDRRQIREQRDQEVPCTVVTSSSPTPKSGRGSTTDT